MRGKDFLAQKQPKTSKFLNICVKTGGCGTLFNASDRGWSVAITMEISDQLSWKWRKLRHVFGDTLSYGAGPPVILYSSVAQIGSNNAL